ncbi:hypothetical protein KM043_004944 [Ampulex compressa]|nr:hypothetical protein KM043_004944 [Ampulex compressa]
MRVSAALSAVRETSPRRTQRSAIGERRKARGWARAMGGVGREEGGGKREEGGAASSSCGAGARRWERADEDEREEEDREWNRNPTLDESQPDSTVCEPRDSVRRDGEGRGQGATHSEVEGGDDGPRRNERSGPISVGIERLASPKESAFRPVARNYTVGDTDSSDPSEIGYRHARLHDIRYFVLQTREPLYETPFRSSFDTDR